MAQQLTGSTTSANIGEALEARVKDPLWFLARQWQTGEFEAENGGSLAYAAASYRDDPFVSITAGDTSKPVNTDDPLEEMIEREAASGDAPAWQAQALEYQFALETEAHVFEGRDYHGRALDWHHLELGKMNPSQAAIETRQIVPTKLHVPGAPHPRWWRFEDADSYFEGPGDPEPNALSLLLPEFAFTDLNNWYVMPLPGRAGSVREVTEFKVVDSFGVVTTLQPSAQITRSFRLFAVDTAEGQMGGTWGGQFLVMPHVAIDILHNHDVEEVRFLRDENANLVWAVEARYQKPDRSFIVNGDGVALPGQNDQTGDNFPPFRFMSSMPEYWIPYTPRQLSPNPATSGEIEMRRARTNPQASAAQPQYKSKLVSDSITLLEEEIPRSGLRVRRISRFARGSDGATHFWVGRLKESGMPPHLPNLKFDFVKE
jgi:hypothetical protein